MKDIFEVFAIKYATVDRIRQSNFLFPVDTGDPSEPMTLDFFIWLIRSNDALVLIDTGFSPASAQRRKRSYLVTPVDALSALGYDANDITDLVVTHLHFDHAGNINKFPKARIWIQERELRYVTGRRMSESAISQYYMVDDIASVIQGLMERRVVIVDGAAEVRNGIELHHVGGHTDGLQVVRVWTKRGWVVVASDSVHYRENLMKGNPFPSVANERDLFAAFETVCALADGRDNIIPSHDPEVCLRYPAVEVEGVLAYRIA